MNARGTLVDSKTARFERLLPGPIERVYAFLTTNEGLSTWLGIGDIEPRVGAKVALGMLPGDQDAPKQTEPHITGEVLKAQPPHLLSFTWLAKRPSAEYADAATHVSVVTFELQPEGEQVRLTLTHEPILPEYRSRTLGGWHALLDTLQARLEGREPEPFMDVFQRLHPEYERQVGG